jgi:hypothetical protein
MNTRRRRVRRIVVRVVVFLLLGAVVNVAVAWGFFMSTSVDGPQITHDTTVPLSAIDHVPPSFYVAIGPATFVTYAYRENRGPGVDILQFGVFEHSGSAVKLQADRVLHVESAGLPFGSMRAIGTIDARGNQTWQHGLALPFDWDQLIASDFWVAPYTRRLPVRPIWPGFAINTFFYAVILWLLFAAPGSVRRWRRIRRGLCAKCAYPFGTSDVCTECGAAIRRPGGAMACGHG